MAVDTIAGLKQKMPAGVPGGEISVRDAKAGAWIGNGEHILKVTLLLHRSRETA